MEKEKQGNPIDDKTCIPTDGGNEHASDKAYYKDLYQDLPGEVVEILMQTHPLMGKKDVAPESTAYRQSKGNLENDVEMVKRARMEQVGKEIEDEIQKEENYIPKRVKEKDSSKELAEDKNKTSEKVPKGNKKPQSSNTMQYEDEDDRVQYIQIKTDGKKKKKTIEEQPPQKKRKHKKNKDLHESAFAEDIDFQEKAKEEHLNCLYDDEEFEEETFVLDEKKKKMLVIAGVAICLMLILLIKCVSLHGKLAKAQEEIAAFNDISSKYEELQMEKLTLEDEINALKNGEPFEEQSAKEKTSGETTAKTSANSGKYDIYTAKQDDTFWDISESFYGNGAYYTKILEANGLKESDIIREGQQLKIPKQ